jgi:3-deoxy-D-manno-octulosonic-acid transferase
MRLRWFWQRLYDILWHFVLLGWSILQLWKVMQGRQRRQALHERLAMYPAMAWQRQPVIWFHASSLGEVMSVTPLMQKLRDRFPHSQLLSVSTVRGEGVARQKSGADRVVYLPLDISYLVRKAIRRIRPDLVVVFETEIWPNLFWECARQNVPVLVVSGRISPRSFPRYQKARPFFASVLQYAHLLMQSQEDRERIIAIGARPAQVAISGDIKFDGIRSELTFEEIQGLQTTFPLSRPILVAGSTHEGEEEMLIAVYEGLKSKWPDLSFVLAPRHLTRLPQVVALLESHKIGYRLRSQPFSNEKSHVILLDTYGELNRVYWLADVVFLGGTLVPVGGHNIAEPAALGKPVVFGPFISNCKRQAEMFLSLNAAIQVKSREDLSECLTSLLADSNKARAIGDKAREVVVANQGAMNQCLDRIETMVVQRP